MRRRMKYRKVTIAAAANNTHAAPAMMPISAPEGMATWLAICVSPAPDPCNGEAGGASMAPLWEPVSPGPALWP